MRRALILLSMPIALVVAVLLLSACLDVTPIVVVEPEAAPDVEGNCLTCLQQPQACAALIERCGFDPRCKPVFACMVQDNCLDYPVLDDKYDCSLMCGMDAGILNASDPVVLDYLAGLVECVHGACAANCGVGDGGVGLKR